MVEVRDRTEGGYKGRPTEASYKDCPCRSCFNAHDMGRYGWNMKKDRRGWIVDMRCATRDRSGCPRPLPEPRHFISNPRGRKCDRCGVLLRGDARKQALYNYRLSTARLQHDIHGYFLRDQDGKRMKPSEEGVPERVEQLMQRLPNSGG